MNVYIACDDVINAMYFHYFVLALFHPCHSIHLDIMGEVSFDVQVLRRGSKATPGEGVMRGGATRAPAPARCVYQYPESAQANALLSNMMNQLTKMFMRTRAYVHGSSARWARGSESRFKVVTRRQQEFFEKVYSNMTSEYRRFYNETTQRVNRAGLDPCDNQREIKQQWGQLLDKSQAYVESAARACVQHLLRGAQNRADDSKTKNKVDQFLERELGKVRTNQLSLLCHDFQLCYNDLLVRDDEVKN